MPSTAPLVSLTPTGVVSDIRSEVLDALQGRTDISDAMVARYVARTVKEITGTMAFEELRSTGPNFTLTAGLAVYPVDLFANPGEQYHYPESFAIYVDYPLNKVVSGLRYRTPKAIEPMLAPATQGVPGYWTRFGGNFHFGPVPLQAFTVFMRYQMKHPFSSPPDISDPLYVPDSWFDIMAYGAAMRIAFAKRWNDQVKDLKELLYGDPEFVMSEGKRGRPGLIVARTLQVERDQKFDTRQLTMAIPRYNAR